jgi:class 3 adenylate cyclase
VISAASLKKSNDSQIRGAETLANENIEGERKTVTALFADIKGSMELIEDLDPEEARAIVDPALKLIMEAVQRYGGYAAPATASSPYSAHRLRMKTTPSALCTQPYECRRSSNATRTASAPKAGSPSRHE